MGPLLSLSDGVALPQSAGNDPDRVLDRLAVALCAHAVEVRREPDAVIFIGGFFRLMRGSNPLFPVGWARIEATRGRTGVVVRYKLSFTEFVVVISSMAVIAMIGMIGMDSEIWPKLVFFVFSVWAVLGGANIALTLISFPAFIRRVATQPDETCSTA